MGSSMNCIFTVHYCDRENGEWDEVFPGLTGNYEWAQKVAEGIWNRDGLTVIPEMMKIYKKCENCLCELCPELCPAGQEKASQGC